MMNTHVRDNLLAVSGIWQGTFTPTLIGFTASSNVMRYTQIGKTVCVSYRWSSPRSRAP